MINTDLDLVTDAVVEFIELGQTIKEAKEDGKISLREGFQIFREGSDVVKAFTRLKNVKIEDVSPKAVDEIATLIFGNIKREVNFSVVSVSEGLKVIQSFVIIGKDIKK